MGLLDGKKAFVFGVANEWSIATHICQAMKREGASLGIAHLPGEKMERRVVKAVESLSPKFYVPCDVQKDEDIKSAFAKAKAEFGTIDILVHSLAFAPPDALEKPFLLTSREAFKTALDISAYSLIAVAREAEPLMAEGGSIMTMTYMGSVKFIPQYNVMAVAKAALECSVRYLAAEMGRSKKVRVNAVSAGPIKTLAAKGIAGFDKMLEHYPPKAPLNRNVDADEVGNAAVYLCSHLASGVTGEVHYVDAGYNTVGW
jgi:enoyl-[acyl-carrier protein] reductase I